MLLSITLSTTIPYARAEYIKEYKNSRHGWFNFLRPDSPFDHLLWVPPQEFVKHLETGKNCCKKIASQMYMAEDAETALIRTGLCVDACFPSENVWSSVVFPSSLLCGLRNHALGGRVVAQSSVDFASFFASVLEPSTRPASGCLSTGICFLFDVSLQHKKQ